jgi:hypothetical protein
MGLKKQGSGHCREQPSDAILPETGRVRNWYVLEPPVCAFNSIPTISISNIFSDSLIKQKKFQVNRPDFYF